MDLPGRRLETGISFASPRRPSKSLRTWFGRFSGAKTPWDSVSTPLPCLIHEPTRQRVILGVDGASARGKVRRTGFWGRCGRDPGAEHAVHPAQLAGLRRLETPRRPCGRRGRGRGRRGGAAALSGGPGVQGRKPAGEHAPVRRSASGGHRDPAARDGEARRGAEHAFGKAPQAPAGAGHALQHGALDVHDPSSRSRRAAGGPGCMRRRRPPSRAS